jgi:hypothetical protein
VLENFHQHSLTSPLEFGLKVNTNNSTLSFCSIILSDLPASLKLLTTSDYLNTPLDTLSPTLTHLTTGHQFNQSVDNLSKTIAHLTTLLVEDVYISKRQTALETHENIANFFVEMSPQQKFFPRRTSLSLG